MGNAHINPNRDRRHGRIYRLVWEGAKASNIASLAEVSPRVLVEALADDNLFWRLTAQRLLVESKPVGVAPLLRTLMAKGGRDAPHALWALQGMDQLDYDTHQAALLSRDSVLKRNAVQALGTTEVDLQLFLDTAVITNKDPHVRRVAFSKMAHFSPHKALKAAIPALFKDPVNRNDEWLSLALQAAATNQGVALLIGELGRNLVVNPSLELTGDAGRGRKLFATHEIAACSRCHKIDGSGWRYRTGSGWNSFEKTVRLFEGEHYRPSSDHG